MRLPVIPLWPNRVRRNYRGGYLLDRLEGDPSPRDGDRPEDWLASTVRAVNPGLEPLADEGLACARAPSGEWIKLHDLFAQAPDYYFGREHVARVGAHPGFLAKLLDSAMRLHVQAHPTAAFAREHLGSPWGKLEAYVILALRDAERSYIRLGFQRPPTPGEWRRIVLEQDIAAMDACFDPIPVRVGEVWLVPGGLPHAIGEGILMLEVMEPSDLVVRCEFVREGVEVPPAARFMGASVDLALQIFDHTARGSVEVRETFRISPTRLSPGVEQLIGPAQTDRFSVTRHRVSGRSDLPACPQVRIGVVAGGEGHLTMGGQQVPLRTGSRFLLAAEAPAGELASAGGEPLTILFCSPGVLA